MFLWCGCHCERGSESEPASAPSQLASLFSASIASASVSGSVQPPPEPPRSACAVCQFRVAPAVYEFEWNYTGKAVKAFPPRPCCSVYSSQKKYRLYARAPIEQAPVFAQCTWGSEEQVKRRKLLPPFGFTATCEDAGGSRVVLTLTKQLSKITARVQVHYYDNTTLANTNNIVAYADYILVDANGNQILNETGSMACLQQLRFRAEWALQRRPPLWIRSTTVQGVPYGSPCDQDSFSMIDSGLPEYVTCTPAAA
jgi:hypothetical protein